MKHHHFFGALLFCIAPIQLAIGQGGPAQDGVTCKVTSSSVYEPDQTKMTQQITCEDGTMQTCIIVITSTHTTRTCDSRNSDDGNSKPEITKTSKGFSVSHEGLRNHLVSFNKPVNHPELIGEAMESVTLAIKVTAKGRVVVKPLRGKEPFVAEAHNAVVRARFKPFVVDGLPVDAEADVTVLFFKDGRVSSTLGDK